MNAGKLDSKITIKRLTKTPDDFGGFQFYIVGRCNGMVQFKAN